MFLLTSRSVMNGCHLDDFEDCTERIVDLIAQSCGTSTWRAAGNHYESS